jgi:Family of unknown function (DUF6278)
MDCWARCEPLRTWARAHGFELDGVPDDFAVLDQALDQASGVLGGPLRIAAVGNQAGLFLGTVIIATVPGTRWRLWPNGRPVVRLPSSRDLDVVAMGQRPGEQGRTPAGRRLRRRSSRPTRLITGTVRTARVAAIADVPQRIRHRISMQRAVGRATRAR